MINARQGQSVEQHTRAPIDQGQPKLLRVKQLHGHTTPHNTSFHTLLVGSVGHHTTRKRPNRPKPTKHALLDKHHDPTTPPRHVPRPICQSTRTCIHEKATRHALVERHHCPTASDAWAGQSVKQHTQGPDRPRPTKARACPTTSWPIPSSMFRRLPTGTRSCLRFIAINPRRPPTPPPPRPRARAQHRRAWDATYREIARSPL